MADNPPAIGLPRQKWREAFWGNQRDRLIAAWRALWQDPTTLALLLHCRETLARHASFPHDPPPLVPIRECVGLDPGLLARVREDVGPGLNSILAALCDRVKQVAPPLAHGLGESLLDFVGNMVAYALGQVEDLPFEMRITRLLPDNPIPLGPGGTVQDLYRVEPKHFHQFHDLVDSYRPRRPRGRPKKTDPAAPPKEQGDPERDKLALEAYRLKRDGLPVHTIARRLLPGADRSERTRDRVRRLVARGARLSPKKLVSK